MLGVLRIQAGILAQRAQSQSAIIYERPIYIALSVYEDAS